MAKSNRTLNYHLSPNNGASEEAVFLLDSLPVRPTMIHIETSSSKIHVAFHPSADATVNDFLLSANIDNPFELASRRVSVYNDDTMAKDVYIAAEY